MTMILRHQGALALAAFLASLAIAAGAQTRIDTPSGGWADSSQAGGFSQDVNYPANRVNVKAGTPLSAQIRGHVTASAKPSCLSSLDESLV